MQNQFSTKLIFLYGCSSKPNHCYYILKFLPNVYIGISVIYIGKIFVFISIRLKNSTPSFP